MNLPTDIKIKQRSIVHITTIPQSLCIFFNGQFRYMQNSGFDVMAISSPGKWLDIFAKREQHIQVFGLKITRKITPIQDLLTLYRLCRLLHRIKPDIVHAHTPKAGLLGTMAAWLVRVPIRIYHIHGLPFMTESGMKKRILMTTEIVACALANRVLCVSNSIMNFVVGQNICAPQKIKTLVNGTINGINAKSKFTPDIFSEQQKCDIKTGYNLRPDSLVIGFVGRLGRDKGIIELCTAWKTLRDEFPNIELLLVGPFEKNTNPLPGNIIEFLHSDDRIHLTGELPDPVPAYRVMDILVLPTHREGFGLAAIEASAMSIPVVATNIPGCVDAVSDGITGTLVPPYDAKELCIRLRNYLLNPQLRKMHGTAGRQRVLNEFSQEKMWEALKNEYVTLLQERGLKSPSINRVLIAGENAHET